jgi:anti-sigma factor RsiW
MMDAAEDEAARFLDLAAFADGSLDPEEQERVEAMLAPDPEAAGDVRAARELAGAAPTSAGLEQIIARAAALAPVTGEVVPFAPRRGGRLVSVLAQWGSIAAAIVLAGWLGFSMGSDASLALRDRPPNDTGLFPEFFDPATGLLRDLGEGLRT